jgi:1-aminocyclopropane-1-carboxylate deaminase/D-cysteine desulfhydrase-like pyridoxal-dependent ACC family enzyme
MPLTGAPAMVPFPLATMIKQTMETAVGASRPHMSRAIKGNRLAINEIRTVRTAAHGKAPYLVPCGGSSATVALYYAFAMQEVLAQGVEVDWMVFATSRGGTWAGLVPGQRIFGYRGRLLGISIDGPSSALALQVAVLASDESRRTRIDFRAWRTKASRLAFSAFGAFWG